MNQEQILQEFQDASAIMDGHFILSSGLHSETYLQCARVLMCPKRAERLCAALTAKVREHITEPIDLVVAPAMGGVIVGYEMARQLGVSSIFCERSEGQFILRRGFDIEDRTRILLVEDVVTTGKSSLETLECIRAYGGEVVAEACLVDRSNSRHHLPFPLISLLELNVITYDGAKLPPHLAEIPAVKPGSRWLKS